MTPPGAAAGRRDLLRGVVFDLDGTLLDSFSAIAASVNHARQTLGLEAIEAERVRGWIGWGLERLLESAFPPGLREPARAAYRGHYAATCVAATRVLPGAREALERMRRLGLSLGVATNKPSGFTTALLSGLGLADLFDAVAGADEVPEPKPHPALLALVLTRLGVRPEQALYVGDMHVDARTGRAAGVEVVGVTTGAETSQELLDAGCTLVVGGLLELAMRLEAGAGPVSAGRQDPGGVDSGPGPLC